MRLTPFLGGTKSHVSFFIRVEHSVSMACYHSEIFKALCKWSGSETAEPEAAENAIVGFSSEAVEKLCFLSEYLTVPSVNSVGCTICCIEA